MSILIKGMEMPQGCGDCPCLGGEYHGSYDNHFYCQVTDKGIGEHKPDWCPLIEVPPHGRLIDADALMNDGWTLHKQVMRMGGYAIHEMPLDNPNVSIVIPADKDGET